MSEFSESFHLATSSPDAAEAMLRGAGISGWVFPPANGWVTVLPDADFMSAPVDALLAASPVLAVYYLCAEDHGWAFRAAKSGADVGRYEAEWEDDIEVNDEGLDVVRLAAALDEAGVGVAPDVLADAFRAPTMDELIDPSRSPGYRVGQVLGWAEYEWLSGMYARHGDAPEGATRVDV